MTADLRTNSTTKFLWISLVLSIIAVAGSLWLSLGMQLKACPLCFYQRSFAMSVMAVLLIGLWAGVRPSTTLGLLALPLATMGFCVACFHVYLEVSGKLECPKGIFGLGTAPTQSAFILGLLFISVLASVFQRNSDSKANHVSVFVKAIAGIVLGAGLAYSAWKSVPPPAPAPTKPYDQPPEICRPPFRA
jgi:disulfide bond formation protein DsbB